MKALDEVDLELIRELQGDIPLAEDPYEALGERLGISGDEVLGRLRGLRASGKLKRIGAILRHQQSGYGSNAMVVFRVSPEEVERIGRQLAASSMVSHCYERPSRGEWPFNLYAMAHGRSEGELASFVSAFAEEHGINAWEILYSREELKKTSMEYVRNPGPEEGGHGEDSIPGEGGRK